MFQTARDFYLDDYDPASNGPLLDLDDEWRHPPDEDDGEIQRQRDSPREHVHRPGTVPRAAVPNTQPVIINQPPDADPRPLNRNDVDAPNFQVDDDSSTDDPAAEVPEPDPDPDPPDEDPVPQHSLRERRHNPCFQGDDWVNTLHWRATCPSPEVAFALNLDWDFPSESDTRHDGLLRRDVILKHQYSRGYAL